MFLCFFRFQYHQYIPLYPPNHYSACVMTKFGIYITKFRQYFTKKHTYPIGSMYGKCRYIYIYTIHGSYGYCLSKKQQDSNLLASFVHHTTLPIPSWSSPGAFNSMTSLVISLHVFEGGCEYQSHATFTLGYS